MGLGSVVSGPGIMAACDFVRRFEAGSWTHLRQKLNGVRCV